uniref:Riboflavin synthase n=1 Tax=Chromera velia CCMP2878 TaxID=1169474 RepID=A0A0G4HEG3_9ALVE|eukprot:Cvel_26759.t1-p1 / transcript=Cvel_26759.t1 / gene=Cvel_26759 / organism=Chromera_velia_CCMP2878 / gene_product=Riboflavin synthase, putative / transcript_product=Riboflavin synthase, putative / location=Cvel_scaffold3233:12728-13594(+) / protein_length=289 / sequence_SO=supercontig / SO=protein_coding / is_pseudo=false
MRGCETLIVSVLLLLARLDGAFTFSLRPSGHFVAPFQGRGGRQSRGVGERTAAFLFSGIVEEMGTVEEILREKEMEMWDGTVGKGTELLIGDAPTSLKDAYIGCSIAVNGVCLTVTEMGDAKFRVGISPETIRRTNLLDLVEGAPVNLERSLQADSRVSGHFVQGHVDGTGEIVDKWRDGESLWIRVRVSEEILKYIVPKGFIAVDGTSLTVCDRDAETSTFTFMLIAHTQGAVIIPKKEKGEKVNIEVDVLGKYVNQSVGPLLDRIMSLEAEVKELSQEVKRLRDKKE